MELKMLLMILTVGILCNHNDIMVKGTVTVNTTFSFEFDNTTEFSIIGRRDKESSNSFTSLFREELSTTNSLKDLAKSETTNRVPSNGKSTTLSRHLSYDGTSVVTTNSFKETEEQEKTGLKETSSSRTYKFGAYTETTPDNLASDRLRKNNDDNNTKETHDENTSSQTNVTCSETLFQNCSDSPEDVTIASRGIVSQDMFLRSFRILSLVSFVLLIVTLIFNAFNIVVYIQPQMRTSAGIYIVAISVCDVISATLSLILQIITEVYGEKTVTSKVYLVYGIYVSNFLTASFKRAVYCLTLVISYERLSAVAKPFTGRFLRAPKNIGWLIFLTLLIILLFHSHVLFRFNIIVLSSGVSGNRTIYGITPSVYQKTSGPAFVILSLVGKVIFVYIPLCVIFVCNIVTLCYMRVHRKVRSRLQAVSSSELPSGAAAEVQTTTAIVISTMLFVFMALPHSTVNFVAQIYDDFSINGKENYLYLMTSRIGVLCEVVGTALDFIVYINISKKYRETFICLFKPGCRRRRVAKFSAELSVSATSNSSRLQSFVSMSETSVRYDVTII